jgi:hypothetical protein
MGGRHDNNTEEAAGEKLREQQGRPKCWREAKGEAPAALTVELLRDVSNVRFELLVGSHENGQAVLFGALKFLGRVDPTLRQERKKKENVKGDALRWVLEKQRRTILEAHRKSVSEPISREGGLIGGLIETLKKRERDQLS